MGNFLVELFKGDNTTGGASVEFWVVTTTLLLLARFTVMSAIVRRLFSSRRVIAPALELLLLLNSYSVSYTLGLMSPSSSSSTEDATVNDLFQVWAVLIVTMNDSGRIGRPYQPKEMTLFDLLTSLWSANELRSQTRLALKVPLWFIWSVHASRIICYFIASNRATEASLDNIKLVSDYMTTSSHHTDDDDNASPADTIMQGYRYIVVGEEEQLMNVKPPGFALEMDLTGPNVARLLTLDKVWERADDGSDRLLSRAADCDGRFKDVCLSFALYKLQRRRFYNFPVAEAAHPVATSRLVSGYILEKASNGSYDYERALRVTEVELSFLHDFFYSRHASVFAGGVPYVRLLLSLLMTASALFLVYVVRNIAPALSLVYVDRNIINQGGNKVARITHGVLVTHCVIGILVFREVVEIGFYLLSQWTKVWVICNYIKLMRVQGGRRQSRTGTVHRLVMEKVARILFRVIRRGRWDQGIRQYNLFMSARAKFPGRMLACRKVRLRGEVKSAVFESLKDLIADIPSALQENNNRPPSPDPSSSSSNKQLPDNTTTKQMNTLLQSYFKRAFQGANEHKSQPPISNTAGKLRGETHKILVWHIATSLCQIKLLGEAEEAGADLYTLPKKPFKNTRFEGARGHYIAAVSLSNYCAYLVTQALVPDNGLAANMVFETVLEEIRHDLSRCGTMPQIYNRFRSPASQSESILGMGAELSETLLGTYQTDELWERLAKFWAGFLLHLSAWTRAAKHKIHLEGRGELTTHLWVLLSHAGFLGPSHGEQMLDPQDLS